MIPEATLSVFQNFLRSKSLKPSHHVVLGSGFGAALDGALHGASPWRDGGALAFHELPGLARSSVADHAGVFRVLEHRQSRKAVVFQCGRLHGYEGHSAQTAVWPVMLSRLSGAENFLLTNAAGGLDPSHRAGDVMLIRDHVNMTGQNPLVGANPRSPDGREIGPRFPDMSHAYDPEWRELLRSELQTELASERIRVHEGVYLGLLGPSFETPAEIELFARWGVQAVGMSTVWETIALRHSGARIAGLSLISNAAAGLGDGQPLEHEAIVEACRLSARSIVSAILKALEKK